MQSQEFPTAITAATAHLAADPVMARLMAEIGPCRLAPMWERTPFQSLLRAVAYQQLHGRAAQAIFGRFLDLYGGAFPEPAAVLATDDARLRGVGLSASKVAAMRDIAAKAADGIVPDRAAAETLSDAELIERLVVIRGVGRWTVEMLLIFTLGRLDVLPLDDFGVVGAFSRAYGVEAKPAKKALAATGEAWRPYRSVASWYLWRLAERPSVKPAPEPP